MMLAVAGKDGKWEDKVDENGRRVQSMQIQAPSMTEEDQYGYTMPERYRCDSCKAVMYHLNEALTNRQPKNRRLREWEYQDLFDETCKSAFKGYGVKLVNGENALSGPALQHEDLQPGMGAIQMGGETWEKRLGEVCRKLVYERIGEDELYEHFRASGALSWDICLEDTHDCRMGPREPREARADQKKRIEKQKEEPTEKRMKKNKKVKAFTKPEAVDAGTFLERLAAEHGLPAQEYTRKRSKKEWEDVVLKVAARISERHSLEGSKSVLQV